jgi:hypothetical protein
MPTGLARKNGGPIKAKVGAKPTSRWEGFFLDLDRDFDQLRRTFRQQRPALDEPKAGVNEVASEQRPDPQETQPMRVSLSGVALALAVSCAWIRYQRWSGSTTRHRRY